MPSMASVLEVNPSRARNPEQPIHGGLAGVQGLTHRPVNDLHAGGLCGAGSDRRERSVPETAQQTVPWPRPPLYGPRCRSRASQRRSAQARRLTRSGSAPRSQRRRPRRRGSGDRSRVSPAAAMAGHSGALPWIVVRSGLNVSSKSSTCAAIPLASAAYPTPARCRVPTIAAVRDPSPPSSAPIPARTRAPSSVAEPAVVQPIQSTRQRTAWCTTSIGEVSRSVPRPRTRPTRD